MSTRRVSRWIALVLLIALLAGTGCRSLWNGKWDWSNDEEPPHPLIAQMEAKRKQDEAFRKAQPAERAKLEQRYRTSNPGAER